MRGVKVEGCSIPSCARPHFGRSFCRRHYERLRQSGDPLGFRGNAFNWKGDQAGYHAVHGRLRRYRGRAQNYVCEQCGGPAQEWAFRKETPPERWHWGLVRGRIFPFSTSPGDYMPLCITCHRLYDAVAS